MKSFPSLLALMASVLVVGTAYGQAPSATPTANPPPAPSVGVQQSAPPQNSKRAECRASTQALKGQDRKDQMQLCLAQARLDCLKQAIDKKVVGPQRRDYIKSCIQGGS